MDVGEGGGNLTNWPEPNSLSGLIPTGRGPGEGGQCQDLDDGGSDKNEKLGIVTREEMLTNKMAIPPPHRAGHDP